jgi:peptidoglycan/xylan/chitin deacetylase (PgdA/CDA1 family)
LIGNLPRTCASLCGGALFLLCVSTYADQIAPDSTEVEIHDHIATRDPGDRRIALTLDACSGRFDRDLLEFLIRNRIPATLFATKRWLDRNPAAILLLKRNLALFDIEDHGAEHIPAVLGANRTVYGIHGEPDIVHLRREVQDGAASIRQSIGAPPHWYRGATGIYDYKAAAEIRAMGYRIAGFSVNADGGATLSRQAIVHRLQGVRAGDVILAHMNKPASDTAEGLSVGLIELLRRGFVFVRLDQVELVEYR